MLLPLVTHQCRLYAVIIVVCLCMSPYQPKDISLDPGTKEQGCMDPGFQYWGKSVLVLHGDVDVSPEFESSLKGQRMPSPSSFLDTHMISSALPPPLASVLSGISRSFDMSSICQRVAGKAQCFKVSCVLMLMLWLCFSAVRVFLFVLSLSWSRHTLGDLSHNVHVPWHVTVVYGKKRYCNFLSRDVLRTRNRTGSIFWGHVTR